MAAGKKRICLIRSGSGSRQGTGGFDYQGKPYDPMLNDPMAVSAETHGDFWEDDIDYPKRSVTKV